MRAKEGSRGVPDVVNYVPGTAQGSAVGESSGRDRPSLPTEQATSPAITGTGSLAGLQVLPLPPAGCVTLSHHSVPQFPHMLKAEQQDPPAGGRGRPVLPPRAHQAGFQALGVRREPE